MADQPVLHVPLGYLGNYLTTHGVQLAEVDEDATRLRLEELVSSALRSRYPLADVSVHLGEECYAGCPVETVSDASIFADVEDVLDLYGVVNRAADETTNWIAFERKESKENGQGWTGDTYFDS